MSELPVAATPTMPYGSDFATDKARNDVSYPQFRRKPHEIAIHATKLSTDPRLTFRCCLPTTTLEP